MPNNTVSLSGSTGPIGSFAYVTYDKPYFAPNLNKSQDPIPSFIFFGGSIKYEQDQFGNMVARNKSGGEA